MAIFDIITDKHPNFRWTQCVNVHLFIHNCEALIRWLSARGPPVWVATCGWSARGGAGGPRAQTRRSSYCRCARSGVQ